MISACRCGSAGPELPCLKPMTQEDGLCDGCRVSACVGLDRWASLPGAPKFTQLPDGRTEVRFADATLVVNSKLWSTE